MHALIAVLTWMNGQAITDSDVHNLTVAAVCIPVFVVLAVVVNRIAEWSEAR